MASVGHRQRERHMREAGVLTAEDIAAIREAVAKLPPLSPEAAARIAAGWAAADQRRRDRQVHEKILATADCRWCGARLADCPDPGGHARLYAQRETTWREAAR